jgi:hypothetical protein
VGHPSPAKLSAYAEDELGPRDAEAVQEHLALCPSCARFYLDLTTFPALDAGEAATALSRDQEREDWAALQDRLAELQGPVEVPPLEEVSAPEAGVETAAALPLTEKRPVPWYRSVSVLQLLSASLLLISMALGAWSFSLFMKRGQPKLNMEIVDLRPVSDIDRGGPGVAAVEEVPAGASSYVFILLSADGGSASEHSVEVADAEQPAGEVLWSGIGLRRREAGSFSLEIPRHLLSPGRYRIRLFEGAGEDRRPLAEYFFRVVAE